MPCTMCCFVPSTDDFKETHEPRDLDVMRSIVRRNDRRLCYDYSISPLMNPLWDLDAVGCDVTQSKLFVFSI